MHRPKKSLGQHFLTDHNIAGKIASSLIDRKTPLLEIGPGTGMLTRHLLEDFSDHLYLIEIDKDAHAVLLELYPDLKERIILADILKVNLHPYFSGPFTIIGNFPYYISSQILFKALEYRSQVKEVVCMIQKEVAERIAAAPGSKTYGILSVLMQAWFDIEYLFTVGEKVFNPPPKVKSAVIRFQRNGVEKLGCNEGLFFKVVKTAFNQRRKTLRNALRSMTPEGVELPERFISERAEKLTVQDFVELTNAIEASQD